MGVWGGGVSPTEALTLFFKSCLRGHFSLETIRNKRMWGGSTAPRLSFMSVSFLYIPSCPSVCITPFVPPPLPLCIQVYETLLWVLPSLLPVPLGGVWVSLGNFFLNQTSIHLQICLNVINKCLIFLYYI